MGVEHLPDLRYPDGDPPCHFCCQQTSTSIHDENRLKIVSGGTWLVSCHVQLSDCISVTLKHVTDTCFNNELLRVDPDWHHVRKAATDVLPAVVIKSLSEIMMRVVK
jgi:hypothetical protein